MIYPYMPLKRIITSYQTCRETMYSAVICTNYFAHP